MGLWSWIKQLFTKSDDQPPTSLVLLLREPRFIDEALYRDAVRKAFAVELPPPSDDNGNCFVVAGAGCSTAYLEWDGYHLLSHHYARPYFDDPNDVASQMGDLRLRKAVMEHTAWLSVDAMVPPQNGEDPYRAIGKLLAELVGDDCVAILAPELQQMNPWEPHLEDVLRSNDPLEAVRTVSQVPVVAIRDDDPLMKAAVAEARARFSEFVGAFEQRDDEQMFAVKAPFVEGKAKEFMWLQVGGIENGIIYGTLDNDPVDLKKLHAGSRVRVRTSELNDWIYRTSGEELVGGFTIEAVKKAARRQGS